VDRDRLIADAEAVREGPMPPSSQQMLARMHDKNK
jgi:hypothetical protein